MKNTRSTKTKIFVCTAALLAAAQWAMAQDPTVRMVPRGSGANAGVAVILEWTGVAAQTAARITNTTRISLFYNGNMGTITKTDVQGTWNQSNHHLVSAVNSNVGVANNPDTFAFIDYTIGGPTDFGNVSTAGTIDTLFRLTFSSPGTTRKVRLLEATNGNGTSFNLDSQYTGGGFIPNMTMRPNASTIFTAYDSDQETAGTAITLPVELIAFEGLRQGKDNLLRWATAQEQNNSHFQLYRSFNGLHYHPVGEPIASQGKGGWSKQILEYQFVDENAWQKQTQIFYKLKQVDFNGAAEWFGPVILHNALNHAYTAYPMPADQTLHLRFSPEFPARQSLKIYDGTGKMIWEDAQPGHQTENSIPTGSLSRGIYYLHIGTPVGVKVKKISVMH